MLEIIRVARFGIVGGLTAIVYFVLLGLQLELLGVHYELAVTTSYVLSIAFHFLANRRFTFDSKESILTGELLKYLVLLIVNYLITIAIVRYVVEGLGSTPYVGVLVSIPVTMVIGYFLAKHWVFERGRVG